MNRADDPDQFMRVTIPVMLTTAYDFKIPADYHTTGTDSFVARIAKHLTDWFGMVDPNRQQGQFDFKVSVYSSLTDSNLPVLTLDTLYLGIDVISDL
jgi:hypothetical protein